MAVFNLLSLELALFISVMLLYTKFKPTKILPLNLVRDLTVYLIPTKGDFDVL